MLDIKELVRAQHRYYKKENPLAGHPDLFGNIIPKRKIRKRRPPKNKLGGQLNNDIKIQNPTSDIHIVASG